MARKKNRPENNPAAAQSTALERFRPLLDESEWPALLAELSQPLPTTLRVNPLKVDPAQAMPAWARRYGWQIEPVEFCPHGWRVLSAATPPSQTIEHRMGFYYIMDAASMLPVELLDFDGLDAPLILDMAASPGGKTTHLIAKSDDRGLTFANDSSQDRITALRIVLQTWGAASAVITHFPGERWGQWFPETFDRVLLDAPCSMQGLRSSESHPMRSITDREQTSLAGRQARLLASAFQALKTGGQMVYSTCTLTPEEDEGVLDDLLRRFPGAVQVDDIGARLPRPAPGLIADGGRDFDPAVQRAARLWPHRLHTSGFFAARLTKLAPVPTDEQPIPSRPLEKTGLTPLSPRESAELCVRLTPQYGWDFAAQLDSRGWTLCRRYSEIYTLPELYLQRFNTFPLQAAGLLLGEETPDGLQLSHEWASRFGLEFTAGVYRLPDGLSSAWLRGEDLHNAPNLPTGGILIVTDEFGRNLGRGKALKDRLKNLLPRRIVF